MSDTPRTDEFARAECCDLQHALDFARKLEREIADWKDKLDGSEITHEATRADLRDCKRELAAERAIVASLQALVTTDHESKEAFIRRCRQTLGISEPARFWVPGESCPECGNDLSVRDHGDGRVYDGEECRCCECAFTGYLSVDEDGQTLVHEYQADEAVDPP